MAFFNQWSSKLTQTGQSAVQKTRDMAEVMRLNSRISEQEQKISQLYTSIGQAYYQRHRDDAAAEEAEQIGEINALSAEIARFREEIKQIRGVVKCPGCGADVALHAAFCNACGARIPQSETAEEPMAEDARICPGCHGVVPKGNLFCSHCGTKLDAAEPKEDP